MIKADLIEAVMNATGYSRADAEEAVNLTLKIVIDALKNGEEVVIRRFGSFAAYPSKRTKGRNLSTGKEVPIPPRNVVRFRPSRHMRIVKED